MSKRVFLITIAVLFCIANLTRWGFRSRYGHPRFMAEGAAHYRYTDIAARGRLVPALDTAAQWPEGLEVYRETSIGMEYLYGAVYRLVPGDRVPLSAFIRVFTAFFFSLSIMPLALLSSELWRSRGAGVLTAALFAVALALVGRSSGYELIRENVTFPFLVCHIYFFFTACTAGSRGCVVRAMISGIFLALAMATWQGTQFYLIPFLFFLLVVRFLGIPGVRERRAVLITFGFVLAAGAAVPFLRHGGFLLSIPVGLVAAWLVADLVMGRRRGASRRVAGAAAALGAFACILVPGLVLRGHLASYAHFFGLVLYKLRFLHKPADPALLPFDARAFWVGPFHSPDLRHFFVFALPLVLLLPAPVSSLLRRARSGMVLAQFVLSFLLICFVLFLLMMRLLPLFGIFAVLAAGGMVVRVPGGAGGRADRNGRRAPWRWSIGRPSVILMVAVIGISLLQDFAWEGPADLWRRLSRLLELPVREKFVIYPYARDVDGELFAWIRGNTERDAVVLTLHYLSPQVLTYTGRPTNLNDFFESPRLRRKAERLLTSLYSSEERLFGLCRELESDYVLVSISTCCDPTRDSPLYQAGFDAVPPGCAAYRFIFEPERLCRFNLVYENEMYRLFRVGEPYVPSAWPRSPLFYEKELLWRHQGDVRGFYHEVMRIYALTARGGLLASEGRRREAEGKFREALRIHYFYPAWRQLMSLIARRGRPEERLALAEFAFRFDPNRVDACIELARSRLDLGETEGVGELLDRAAALAATGRDRAALERLRRRFDTLVR